MLALDPVDPPGQPVAIDITKWSVTIQWTKPEYDGGFKITGYTVEKKDLPNGRWVKANFSNIVETVFTISGLTENASYEFRVSARNSAGAVSEPSEPSDPITCKDDIEEPRVMVDAKFKDVILVKAGDVFKLEADVAGQPLPSIVWTKDGKEVENTMKLQIKTSDLTAALINKDSLRRDGGMFTLTASNLGGFAKHIFNVKVLDRPGPPRGPLAVTDLTAENCVLTWSPPSDDGGANINHYVVEKRETSRLAWTNVASEVCAVSKAGVGEHADVPGTVLVEDKMEEPELDLGAELMKMLNIKAGNTLRVFIPIKGRPAPAIKWEKIDGEIKERAQIEVTSRHTCLVIDNVNRFDSGKYTVTAENSSGSKSAVVSIRVLDTPSAPVNLKVKEITKQKTYSAVTTNCHKTTWKIEPLQEGCNYYFRVLAENEHGIGLSAETVDALKVSEVPQSPASLTVVDVTRNSVSLAWEKPEHDGGSKIFQYLVDIQKKDSDKWINCANVKTLETVVSNLVQGEEYIFRVIAANEKGKSDPRTLAVPVQVKDLVIEPDVRPVFSSYAVPVDKDLKVEIPISGRPKPNITWTKDGSPLRQTTRVNVVDTEHFTIYGISEPLDSAQVIMKNPFVTPGSPHILEVSNITRDSMTVCWAPPDTDGGSEIIGYIIEKKDRSGIRWTRCNRQKVTDVCFRVTCLAEDHEYEFKVSAENAAGLGEPSLPSAYYKAYDPKFKPGPPTHVHVIDTTKSSISITWGKPVHDGGSAIQGYIVEICKAENEEWIMCTPPTGLRVNKFEIHKLIENQEYNIRVCAMNKIGVGELAAIPGTAKPEEKTEGPELSLDSELRKGIVVRAGGSVRINIPFRGRPSPDIGWSKDEAELSDKVLIEKGLNYTQLSIDGCDRNDTGKYTLKLENKSGSVSEFVSVKVLDTPGPPLNLEMKEIKKDSVTLVWEPPVTDGGAKIKNYVVDKRESTRKTYSNVTAKCLKTCFKVENIVEGAMYYFRVMAENEFGVGQPVELKNAVKASEIPLPVGKVTLIDVTKSSVSLAWEKPEHDGGSRITGYLIEMQPKGTDKWGVTTSTKTCDGIVSALTAGQEYSFRVIAYNEKGKSDPTPLAAPVIANDLNIEPSFRLLFNSYNVKSGKDLKIEIPVIGRTRFKEGPNLAKEVQSSLQLTHHKKRPAMIHLQIYIYDILDHCGILPVALRMTPPPHAFKNGVIGILLDSYIFSWSEVWHNWPSTVF
uniref:Titin n=1 Tax=Paramormyrops kingsleyae TaxID=1676925 RepID=A0A3B3QDG0_9TELE